MIKEIILTSANKAESNGDFYDYLLTFTDEGDGIFKVNMSSNCANKLAELNNIKVQEV